MECLPGGGQDCPANQESQRARRYDAATFKAEVALAIKGEMTLVQLAEQFDVRPNQITQWKSQLQEAPAEVLGPDGSNRTTEPAVEVKNRTIFLEVALRSRLAERKAMIDREPDLPITNQAEVLKTGLGSVYCLSHPVSHSGSSLLRIAVVPRGSLTLAEAPLIERGIAVQETRTTSAAEI